MLCFDEHHCQQGGLSLLLLERSMPGIKVRRMKTQFDSSHGFVLVRYCLSYLGSPCIAGLSMLSQAILFLDTARGLGLIALVWILSCQARLCSSPSTLYSYVMPINFLFDVDLHILNGKHFC